MHWPRIQATILDQKPFFVIRIKYRSAAVRQRSTGFREALLLSIEEFQKSFPDARMIALLVTELSQSFMAKLREEPDSDDGSSPDEGVPGKSSGYRGQGEPMKVGVEYIQRGFCDGQSLACPGRWAPGSRVYPSSNAWNLVADCYRRFTRHHGAEQLLVPLAVGKIVKCPSPLENVAELKQAAIDAAASCNVRIQRRAGVRTDLFCFGDGSHQRDARHSRHREDWRDAETAHEVLLCCTT